MARYSEEFKESIIQKMMPPNNVPVSQLVLETGISDVTLYTWRKNAVSKGVPVPGDGKNSDLWNAEWNKKKIKRTPTFGNWNKKDGIKRTPTF
ncbi:transposase [Salinisphaera sp. G21_0]|uniref:transposase n=1 Tax=Salinisphaera sp. G21_0 TaxID=2821094 RepID=UPI001ADA2A16|nr:transposase [Salinisphaera sp. G21_0]MBO9483337.1 transposase [Salinisphaera sp. G21_0]